MVSIRGFALLSPSPRMHLGAAQDPAVGQIQALPGYEQAALIHADRDKPAACALAFHSSLVPWVTRR